jgi:hypothetical protein
MAPWLPHPLGEADKGRYFMRATFDQLPSPPSPPSPAKRGRGIDLPLSAWERGRVRNFCILFHQGGRDLYLPLSVHIGGGDRGHVQCEARERKDKPRQRRCTAVWGWWLGVGCLALLSLTTCRATVGRVIGQQFVSPTYAFEVPLPGDEWQPVLDEPSVLTLSHPQLAAGITISVTCNQERDVPLDILTRHLFFGFKNMQVLRQEPQAINGVPAMETVARARLDAHEVQVHSYVVRRDGCVYDMVYFASPQDYARGEPSFTRMMAGFRFLQR